MADRGAQVRPDRRHRLRHDQDRRPGLRKLAEAIARRHPDWTAINCAAVAKQQWTMQTYDQLSTLQRRDQLLQARSVRVEVAIAQIDQHHREIEKSGQDAVELERFPNPAFAIEIEIESLIIGPVAKVVADVALALSRGDLERRVPTDGIEGRLLEVSESVNASCQKLATTLHAAGEALESLSSGRELARVELEAEGYTEPTPIQREAVPAVIGKRDVLGIAKTGSGKTAGYVLPILHNLQTAPHTIVAHRTSPTNIGLYLLSVACARQFGPLDAGLRKATGAPTRAPLQRVAMHVRPWPSRASIPSWR